MNAPDQEQSAVAAAVQQVAAETAAAAPQPPAEPTIHVSGQAFFQVCQYIGSKPLRMVVQLRQALWAIQKEQNCVNQQQLPEKVWLTQTAVNTLQQFLAEMPCDEVFDVLSAFERDVGADVQRQQEAAQAAAAQKAIDDAAAQKASDDAAAAAAAADPSVVTDATILSETPVAAVVEAADALEAVSNEAAAS